MLFATETISRAIEFNFSEVIRVKTHKLEMSLWFAAFRILLPDALTQNLRVASDTYTFMSLDPSQCQIAAQKRTFSVRHQAAADLLEHFHGCERFSRPRPETVQSELCLLSGLDINKEVVVLLLRRLALPIEVSRIARRHLDGRAARENGVLFCAAAAQQQVLHAVHLV